MFSQLVCTISFSQTFPADFDRNHSCGQKMDTPIQTHANLAVGRRQSFCENQQQLQNLDYFVLIDFVTRLY